VHSHRWHRSQEAFLRGGRIHVRLKVRLCPEVISWVLGFGPEARVVGPPALRRRIAHLVQQMARVHAPEGR
jgi:predicted DNA-binding transcriptional regulator YafY